MARPSPLLKATGRSNFGTWRPARWRSRSEDIWARWATRRRFPQTETLWLVAEPTARCASGLRHRLTKSIKEKGNENENGNPKSQITNARWLHTDRASGRHRHHRDPGQLAPACPGEGQSQ